MFLNGKTILITRPKAQSVLFSNQLKALGAKVISLPLIQLEAINKKELRLVFNQHQFDWIVFTSYNAVTTFFEVIRKDLFKAKIAVVGQETKETVEKLGLNVDFMPKEFKAAVLGKEIPILPNEKIFIPLSELANDNLINQLKQRAAQVFSIKTYQNTPIFYTKKELKQLLSQPLDFITFTSASCVNAFLKLDIPTNNIALIYIGPETAKVAQKNNLRIDAVASEYTTGGMIDAIKMLLS